MPYAIIGYSNSSTTGQPFFNIASGFSSAAEAAAEAKQEQMSSLSDIALKYVYYSDFGSPNIGEVLNELNGIYVSKENVQNQYPDTYSNTYANQIISGTYSEHAGLELTPEIAAEIKQRYNTDVPASLYTATEEKNKPDYTGLIFLALALFLAITFAVKDGK